MKYLSIIKYALLLVGVIVGILGMTEVSVDTMLYWAYALIILTIVLTVALPLIGIAQNPKSAKKSLLGLALLVVVFGLAYAMSDATPITLAGGSVIDSEFALKFADTGLWATYFMFGGVIISIVGSEVYKLLK